jgi:hypothetical protein
MKQVRCEFFSNSSTEACITQCGNEMVSPCSIHAGKFETKHSLKLNCCQTQEAKQSKKISATVQ